MAYAVPQLTNYGMSLLLRSLGGETITFTRMAIGNGNMSDGADPTELDELINEQLSFGIVSIESELGDSVRIIGRFDSTQIESDFRWKELGIYCKGEDNIEKLYAYCNDGDNAGMLKADSSDVTVEQTIGVIIEVGRASSVTAIIAPSVMYLQKSEFDEHLQAENPHGITAETVNLGNVPNVPTNDQTPTYSEAQELEPLTSGEKLSAVLSKVAKSIKSLIAHLSDYTNPHRVTAMGINAADREHTHTAADINAGTLGVARGGTGVTSYELLKEKLGVNDSLFNFGVYNGDGTAGREINLGYRPKAVLVITSNGQMGGTPNSDIFRLYGGLALDGYAVSSGNNKVEITSNGFVVSGECNYKNGTYYITYYYIAIKSDSEIVVHS